MERQRVVIADDETIVRMDIREILEANGYEVVGEASDGIDAVELCRQQNPDLVLLDIKMPLMDGLSAAKQIHETNGNVAIVILTAYNDERFIDKAAEYGSVGYVVKPLNERSLIPAIKIALKRAADFVKLKTELEEQKQKLEDRKIIDRAKGYLMKEQGMEEDAAYQYLRSLSMKKRVSIRDISEIILNSGKMMNT
ncbi:MAG: response regulator [Lachnospiraceae bacterium]|nr:response regulator [Lachnospiraceae bacterium]MDY5541425.1 response regulator [Lachnospiraceae bacterium]MDY5647665.1 response regulator [Lachnospiraceae bacterium]